MNDDRMVAVTGVGVCTPTIPDSIALAKRINSESQGLDSITLNHGPSWSTRERFCSSESVAALHSLILSTVEQSCRSAGMTATDQKLDDLGVAFGTYYGMRHCSENIMGILACRDARWIDPWIFPLFADSSPADATSIAKHGRAPGCTYLGLSGAAEAVGNALYAIRHRRADMMICVGYDRISAFLHEAIIKSAAGASIPAYSDGAGALVLEEFDHAAKRGAPILAQICGYASRGPAHTEIEEVDAIVRTMERALENACIPLSSVDFIIPSSPCLYFDSERERLAIRRLFGKSGSPALRSFRHVFGYTLGAAPVLDIAALCLQVEWNPGGHRIGLVNSWGGHSCYTSMVIRLRPYDVV